MWPLLKINIERGFDMARNLSTRDEIMTRKIRNLAKGERKTLSKAIYKAIYVTHVHAKEAALISRNLFWSRGDILESNNFFFLIQLRFPRWKMHNNKMRRLLFQVWKPHLRMPIFDENNFVSSKRFQYKPIQFQFTFERINHHAITYCNYKFL